MFWDGQHGPSVIVDVCADAHTEKDTLLSKQKKEKQKRKKKKEKEHEHEHAQQAQKTASPTAAFYNLSTSDIGSYGSLLAIEEDELLGCDYIDSHSLRFQVVVWSVGNIDVRHNRVPVKFRITLFWNDRQQQPPSPQQFDNESVTSSASEKYYHPTRFQMCGRQKAVLIDDETTTVDDGVGDTTTTTTTNSNHRQQQQASTNKKTMVDVPPISIINAESFDIIGRPEVNLLRKDSRLMRWTCLYKALLLQEGMTVDSFPHDQHSLQLKIGVLQHRKPGARWDKNSWKLALATQNDSQNSTRIPYGLIVDHVQIPEFSYDPEEGLQFDFVPLGFGSNSSTNDTSSVTKNNHNSDDDVCLKVSLNIRRDSGYYDNNVAPLLAVLNIVGVSVHALDATNFFQRALLLFNITFVQIGLRMSIDSKLPSVGYEIKLQSIMNSFLYTLLFQVLESAILYMLLLGKNYTGVNEHDSRIFDICTASIILTHIISLILWYYKDWNPLHKIICHYCCCTTGTRKYQSRNKKHTLLEIIN